MPAYVVADIEVTDAEHFKQYLLAAPEHVKRFQGRYLVRGGNPDTREGDWRPQRIVILEFPNMELARALLDDPDYQAVARIRQATTISNLVLVEGVE